MAKEEKEGGDEAEESMENHGGIRMRHVGAAARWACQWTYR